MKKTNTDPTAFLETLDTTFKTDLIFLDKEISKIMKGLPRILWQGTFWGGSEQNIIGYGELSYKNSTGKNVEWFMIGLAQQKNYISLYVNAVDGKQYFTEKYASKLGTVKAGKSSISFKKLEDINLNTLSELLTNAREIMLKQ